MSAGWLIVAAAATLADCDDLALRGATAAPACYRQVASSTADDGLRARALWRSGDVAGANAAFRLAVAARPNDAALRASWGHLFLEVHQEADAQALFQEALEQEGEQVDALLGMAELSLGRFEPGVKAYVDRVLAQDPREGRAHLLLARMDLELGRVDDARAMLQGLLDDGVLEGAERLQAYALLAAADGLQGTLQSPWIGQALAVNAGFGDVYAVPARQFVINRRYRQAVAFYQRALDLQPDAWDVHAELGINLLRVNQPAAARTHLERAYEGDPYNALTVNTLRLLDLLDDDFATLDSAGLLMRAPASQAAALAPHVVPLADRARREMGPRYGYLPEGPVVVELYEHHDDFAVRTAGLPGLGILGATFGDVVVMDGPAAKGIDDGFDWASALWHELGHVYTLGATDNAVSRWLSEGVSVLEEWDRGPTPQRAVPLHFLEAFAQQRLLPVTELDEGFLRPRHPQQIAISYVQAGLLCQLIEAQFNDGVAGMLRAYRAGADTVEAVRQGLGVEPAELDRRFDAYLDGRFGGVAAALPDLREALQLAQRAEQDKDWPAARAAAQRALALYPEYVQADGGYLVLARAAEALGDPALLEATLTDYVARGGRSPWAMTRLAERHQSAGRLAPELSVRRTLARTLPLNGGVQRDLADRLAAAGRNEEALAAYQTTLALAPHDRAAIQLALAETLHRLGRDDEARRAVLQALELAPRYPAALDLLLTLEGESIDHE